MKRGMKRSLAIAAACALLPAAIWAWPWSRDMMNMPHIKPQEPGVRPFPKDSVPVDGLWTKIPDRDASVDLKNPIPPTKQSLRMGRALFRIYCMPCHGEGGKGDGPVGKVFEVTPADLTSDYVKNELTDGWIWGTITFGSYIMPRYGYDMSPEERWHVVNYIRYVLEKKPLPEMAKEIHTAEKEEN